MKKFFEKLRADKIVFRSNAAALILLVLTLLIAGASYFYLPPVIPLFNQMPWGEGRLGIRETIALPAVLALLVFLLNTSLALGVYAKMPLVSRIIATTTVFTTIFALLLTIRTVLLVL